MLRPCQNVQEVVHDQAGEVTVATEVLDALSIGHAQLVTIGGVDQLCFSLGEVGEGGVVCGTVR